MDTGAQLTFSFVLCQDLGSEKAVILIVSHRHVSTLVLNPIKLPIITWRLVPRNGLRTSVSRVLGSQVCKANHDLKLLGKENEFENVFEQGGLLTALR